ncbi:hypothetical protein SNEBB_007357 [Seison nebaliae]|nr:hypothetical protein SNEBB_007357 [Seison nebaliae]
MFGIDYLLEKNNDKESNLLESFNNIEDIDLKYSSSSSSSSPRSTNRKRKIIEEKNEVPENNDKRRKMTEMTPLNALMTMATIVNEDARGTFNSSSTESNEDGWIHTDMENENHDESNSRKINKKSETFYSDTLTNVLTEFLTNHRLKNEVTNTNDQSDYINDIGSTILPNSNNDNKTVSPSPNQQSRTYSPKFGKPENFNLMTNDDIGKKCNFELLSSAAAAAGFFAVVRRKRKSRTAFTAHQIYELEKSFAKQKYLSPHDRDRIATTLGLTAAQVITWFQNRRAKMKRDIEEMRNDLMTNSSGFTSLAPMKMEKS